MLTLHVPVPPMLEQALGYEGSATWVSFYWEPAGDEAMYDDGRVSGTGEWDAFLVYTRHRRGAPSLAPYNLGSSDAPAHHRLVLQRQTRTLYIAPASEAARHVQAQWPIVSGMAELTAADVERLSQEYQRAIQERLLRPQEDIIAEVEARMALHVRELEELTIWLDTWSQREY